MPPLPAPPLSHRGFHLLVKDAETPALQHGLATSQVKFCLASGDQMSLCSSARVIAHGHCSINVILADPNCVS